MIRLRCLGLASAALLALGLTASGSGAAQSDDLESAKQRIRSGFLGQDADQLVRLFPDGERVWIDLPPFTSGSFLGPGPLRALLERLVRDTEPARFTFSDDTFGLLGRPSAADTAFLKATWTYRDRESDRPQTTELYLSLRLTDEGAWRIVEIKAGR